MLFTDTINTALSALKESLGRSLLTMLGIVIGVGSVVLMTAIGESMEGVILGQISSLGAESMVIFPGNQEGPPSQSLAGYDRLVWDDIEELQKLETIKSIAPVVFIEGSTSYGREEVVHTVMGTNQNFFRNQSIQAKEGRLIDEDDDMRGRFVAVIGVDTARDLFGNVNPVNKTISVAGRTFTVVGVMKSVGQQFFQNFDERIFVPLSVAKNITGKRYANYMTLQKTVSFDAAFRDIRSLLRQRHGIINPNDDPEEDDFTVRSSKQANQILGSVSLGLTIFITVIASISLIVGGIGIMNIMLVTVTERTREIGLRKALGAHKRDILLQFLIESVALTFLGAIIGLLLGVCLAAIIALIIEKFLEKYMFALSVPAIFIALFMAGVTGVAFGIYPARKAASVHPIESLRYE